MIRGNFRNNLHCEVSPGPKGHMLRDKVEQPQEFRSSIARMVIFQGSRITSLSCLLFKKYLLLSNLRRSPYLLSLSTHTQHLCWIFRVTYSSTLGVLDSHFAYPPSTNFFNTRTPSIHLSEHLMAGSSAPHDQPPPLQPSVPHIKAAQ